MIQRLTTAIRASAAKMLFHAAMGLLLLCMLPIDAQAGAMLVHISQVRPRVVQRGMIATVTIQGMCLRGAREIVFYRPGLKAIEITELPDLEHPIGTMHGGIIKEQIQCRIEISPECELGEHPFRVRTATELSSLSTLHVGRFPVMYEDESRSAPNDSLEHAKAIESNTTILATMNSSGRGDVDLFKVPVTKGQVLSAEVDSVRLADTHYGGSEFDLSARILDYSGRELCSNDDNPLHLQDPIVSSAIDYDGFAFVEVRRSLFVPHDQVYAVHIGNYRRPMVAFPLGGKANTSLSVRWIGDPLGEFNRTISVPQSTGTFGYMDEEPSPVMLRSSPYGNAFEQTDTPETLIDKLPIAINGRIDQRGDIDTFRVKAVRGTRYRIRVYAASLGSNIDPKIRIRRADNSAKGSVIEVEADDSQLIDRDVFGTAFRGRGGLKDVLDPSVIWTPSEDADYWIDLEDTSGNGGPMSVYRIEIEPAYDSVYTVLNSTAFDWMECVRTSSLAIPAGSRWTVTLSLPQGQGSQFSGELDLEAIGLPQGVRMVPARVPKGRTLWPIQFEADANASPSASLIEIIARPVEPIEHFHSSSQQSFPFINHSGGDAWRTVRTQQFAVAVTDAPPFQIELRPPRAALVRGGELAIPFTINRSEGFNEPIEFQCEWLPSGVSAQPATLIEAAQSAGVMRVSCDGNAPLGTFPFTIVTTTVRDDLDAYLGTGRIRVSSPTVDLRVEEPFVELSSAPESIRRGATIEYRWSVKHKSPFDGPATIHLLGLPKGVTVAKPLPIIDKNTSEVIFTVSATDEALLGNANGISCEVIVQMDGQEIRQRTGAGTLRIDPAIPK